MSSHRVSYVSQALLAVAVLSLPAPRPADAEPPNAAQPAGRDRPNPRSKDDKHPLVPVTWDVTELASMELPLARAGFEVQHASPETYYRLPIRDIFQPYPVYAPGAKGVPADYIATLKQKAPVLLWGRGITPPLNSEADWIAAGKLVFEAATAFEDSQLQNVLDKGWYDATRMPTTKAGIMPFFRYVVRKEGITVGTFSCAMCHTRVMADGTVIEGAQGNFPATQTIARADAADHADLSGRMKGAGRDAVEKAFLNDPDRRDLLRALYGAPWLKDHDPFRLLDGVQQQRGLPELLDYLKSFPPGVQFRQGTSVLSPVQVPDLIGIRDRKYLDRTGLGRHRGIGDLMRYSALNQGAEALSRYGNFIPDSGYAALNLDTRYSDVQLFALAKYLYSLKPPANPNLPKSSGEKALVVRGEKVFKTQNCGRCHEAPLYTDNRLTPASGFDVPARERERLDVHDGGVGTDSTLALYTRRGTGYYKVPSLLGLWYRGPFEHNGSCKTLEDWFDPRRLSADYVPTGWPGPPGTKARAVPGHPYGLKLDANDRVALIAFLRTL